MGNYTEIQIEKDGKTLAIASGGRRLHASVYNHKNLVKGFVHESGQYQTEAHDDFNSNKKSFDIKVNEYLVRINSVESNLAVGFDFERFNEEILEGFRLREDLNLPEEFLLEVLVPYFEGATEPDEFEWIRFTVNHGEVTPVEI